MLPVLALLFSFVILPSASDAGAEKEVLAAMNAWRQAVVARDRAALEALYAPNLIYSHSSGKQENKSEAIDAIMNGKDRIESIGLADSSVYIYGKTALVKSKVLMHLSSDGKSSAINLDVLHVWIKMSSRWRMVARHATRLNP
jgi:ketosteroid isomerase-like protein